jgi:hypothetical protein
MRALNFAVALTAVLPLASLRAQFAEVQPGARVRLSAPSALGQTLTGTVLARPHDSVTVARQGTLPVTIALADLRSLEISEGKSRSAGAKRGAIIGGSILGVLGIVAAAAAESCKPDVVFDCYEFSWSAVPLTIASGALYGAGIGALIGREKWQTLRVPASVSVRRMSGGRVGVGASMQF